MPQPFLHVRLVVANGRRDRGRIGEPIGRVRRQALLGEANQVEGIEGDLGREPFEDDATALVAYRQIEFGDRGAARVLQ